MASYVPEPPLEFGLALQPLSKQQPAEKSTHLSIVEIRPVCPWIHPGLRAPDIWETLKALSPPPVAGDKLSPGSAREQGDALGRAQGTIRPGDLGLRSQRLASTQAANFAAYSLEEQEGSVAYLHLSAANAETLFCQEINSRGANCPGRAPRPSQGDRRSATLRVAAARSSRRARRFKASRCGRAAASHRLALRGETL